MWGTGFWGSKEDLNVKVLGSMPYLRLLTLMSLGVLISLGVMTSCRHTFMYAREATGLPPLLGTAGLLLITIAIPGDVN